MEGAWEFISVYEALNLVGHDYEPAEQSTAPLILCHKNYFVPKRMFSTTMLVHVLEYRLKHDTTTI